MPDRAKLGSTFGPRFIDVELGQLRLFAKSIGAAEPKYADAVPLTYVFCLDQLTPSGWLSAVGIDITRMLHAEQGFEYFKPIYVGDKIEINSRVAEMFDKKGGALSFVVIETDFDNKAGERCARMRTTVVQRNG